jgi:phosphoribosylamine--glycine ligase
VRVLVLGSGAREHAIVHALRRSEGVEELFAAPGNPGIAQAADLLSVAADDLPGVAEAAADLRIDLTVVGPELPLAFGIGDEFARRGLRLFGPNRLAAELEASKVFAKEFCLRHGIPTAGAKVVRDKDEAVAAARERGFPVVLKADGLAAGKGVLMVHDKQDLEAAVDSFFVTRRFGEAGDRVLVEECLAGVEGSVMVISDGSNVVPIATSHDYKRARRHILDEIVRPTISGMAAEGREYRGVLYLGLMLTDDGPKVLEFNCRLGDPETQAILLRLDDNLAEAARDAADGKLQVPTLNWRREVGVCVVLAADGYPGSPRKGDEIRGVEEAMAMPGVTVYHAGTKIDDGTLVTSGGRVLSVCGRASTLAEALTLTYRGVENISFDGMHYRSDIGADTMGKLSEGTAGE